MYTRRRFASLIVGGFGAGALLGSLGGLARRTWAAGRKVLTKATKRESLIHENPANLDTTNMTITPLDEFDTMGPTDRVVDLAAWRLEIAGLVRRPAGFTYAELAVLPTIEREVLLICPGVFANHGHWKGFSIAALLRQAHVDPTADRVTIESTSGKTSHFAMEDVLSDRVFFATHVNGTTLPRKHGFPLRVVAEDHYGGEWVKYVSKLTVERA